MESDQNFLVKENSRNTYPEDPYMVYLPAFTIKIINMSYMDPIRYENSILDGWKACPDRMATFQCPSSSLTKSAFLTVSC